MVNKIKQLRLRWYAIDTPDTANLVQERQRRQARLRPPTASAEGVRDPHSGAPAGFSGLG